jgi:hypothetical protein
MLIVRFDIILFFPTTSRMEAKHEKGYLKKGGDRRGQGPANIDE